MALQNTSLTTTSKQKIASAKVLGILAGRKSLVHLMTEDISSAMQSKKYMQTNKNAPVVMINDLTKTHGTSYSFDMLGRLNAKPVMGNRNVDGKEQNVFSSDFTIKINASRLPIEDGGLMTRQSFGWDLNKAGWDFLLDYFARLQDQRSIIALAGARGDYVAEDIIVPLASDVGADGGASFNDIMVNPVTTPTDQRYFLSGGRDNVSQFAAGDELALADISQVRRQLDEMANPMMGVSMRGDLQMDQSMYVGLITPRQWQNVSTETGFQQLQANALERVKNWGGHVLFKNEMFMWENILFIKNNFPVRFNAGTSVTSPGGSHNVPGNTTVERGIILGGQALAVAMGNADMALKANTTTADAGLGLSMFQDNRNAGAVGRITGTMVNGCGKIIMSDMKGNNLDRGVAVIDTLVSST